MEDIISKGLKMQISIDNGCKKIAIADMDDAQASAVLREIDAAIAISPDGRVKMAYDKVCEMVDAPADDKEWLAAFAYFFSYDMVFDIPR